MAGRPRSFDRDRALEQALHAFWRDGYERTSIATLTDTIGINPPSLYAAFGDKDALFREAAASYVERFRSGLAQALDAPTAREALADLLQITARAHTEPGTPPGCLVLSEDRLRSERERMRSTIAARIIRGQQDGDVPPEVHADALAGYIDVVMAGMSARARDGADRDALLTTAELALAAVPPSAVRSDRY